MKHLIFGRSRALHIQFLRYFFVGGTSSVIDLLVFIVLIEYVGLHYLIAAFFGYMIGLIWNYILCIVWVFESKHSRTKEIVLVVLVTLGGLLWTELLLYFFVEFIHIIPIIAKIIVLWIVLLWNFGMRRHYVFR